jgi:hypothetical protein
VATGDAIHTLHTTRGASLVAGDVVTLFSDSAYELRSTSDNLATVYGSTILKYGIKRLALYVRQTGTTYDQNISFRFYLGSYHNFTSTDMTINAGASQTGNLMAGHSNTGVNNGQIVQFDYLNHVLPFGHYLYCLAGTAPTVGTCQVHLYGFTN